MFFKINFKQINFPTFNLMDSVQCINIVWGLSLLISSGIERVFKVVQQPTSICQVAKGAMGHHYSPQSYLLSIVFSMSLMIYLMFFV